MSKSTFYKYIDLGILNVKNIDLQRKVRYRVKKEYDYTRAKPKTMVLSSVVSTVTFRISLSITLMLPSLKWIPLSAPKPRICIGFVCRMFC